MSPWPAPDENERRLWAVVDLNTWAIAHPRIEGGKVAVRRNFLYALDLACSEFRHFG